MLIAIKQYCLLLLLFLTQWIVVEAQQPGYWHLSDAEGLPTNTVYNIMEDQMGFIYLGTQNGLVKFDGFNFEKFTNTEAKASDVTNIQQDSKGKLWFSNFNHELFVMDADKKIKKIKQVNETNFNSTGAFYIDYKDNIWFNSVVDIMRYDAISQTVVASKINNSYISNLGRYGQNGFYFTSSDAAICTFDAYPNLKLKVKLKTGTRILKHSELIIDTGNYMVLPVRNNVTEVEKGMYKLSLTDFLKQGYYVNNFGMLANKTIWIATSNGVLFFDKNGHVLNNGNFYMEGNNASFVLCDSKGNYWFSTLDNGIFMVSNFTVSNYTFFKENNIINGTTCLSKVGNLLYAGTQNGEIIVIDQNNKFRTWKTEIDRSIYIIKPVKETSQLMINNKFIDPLTGVARNISWLGSTKAFEFNGDQVIVSSNNSLMSLSKKAFTDNSENTLSEYHFVELDENGKVLSRTSKNINSKILFNGRSSRMFSDSKERIWCSTTAGIIYIDKTKIYKINLTGFPNAVATDFAEDESGNIYFFIANVGLYQWNNKGARKLFSEKNGLLSNSATRLLYANQRLWIGTSMGLNAIEIKTKKIWAYRISDGLLSNVILDIAVFNNRIWLATYKGLCSLPDNFISYNNYAPQLYLNNIKINNKIISIDDITTNKIFSYTQNNFEFSFTGINYRSREFLYYQYRLTGQSDQWIRISGQRNSVAFQDLSSGDYVFEVQAFNDQGISSQTIIKIPFTIKRPWWGTWWFWTTLTLLLGGTIFYVYRERIIEKQKQAKLQDDLRISQLTSLKAQMNPHFMFNALNSIQDFILLNEKKSANMYLGKFSDLMRLILDMSNQPYVTLANELKALNLYLELESVRFENTLEYQLNIDPDIDITDWQLPSMIIQPFVENAIKHGLLHKRNNRKLSIDFNLKERLLLVTITDNGIGRQEADRINTERQKKHTSFATGATTRRLELLNKKEKQQIQINYTDLMDENKQPAGTKVELTIALIPVTQ